MELTDDQIIEQVRRGDRERFLELYRRHHRRIESYARRQLRSAELARDIASETFLRAYRSIEAFRTGERLSFAGYLFLICRRLIFNELDRIRASRTVSMEDEAAVGALLVEDLTPAPLAGILDEERNRMVRAALEELSPDDQEIIRLAFEKDLSRRDIMQILGKPSVSAVTTQLHRAMTRLKQVLEEQGYFAEVREMRQE